MKIYKRLMMLIICCLPLFATVQAQESASAKQRKLAKQKEKKDNEALRLYQKAIKRHHKIQSKSTRKEMRRGLRKSKNAFSNKKDFFLKRWFINSKKPVSSKTR